MEQQYTGFICITYWRKQNSSVLLTSEWCTEQLQLDRGPYVPYRQTAKITITVEQSCAGTIDMFHLFNSLGDTEW